MPSAAGYIREMSAVMADRYADDCVVHASRAAGLLLAEGRSPWIGCVRDVRETGDARFYGPLIPLRYAGKGAMAWTVHYFACAAREVFDPLAGAPIDIDEYALEVFGRPLPVQTHLDPPETARLLAGGDFRRAFHLAAEPRPS